MKLRSLIAWPAVLVGALTLAGCSEESSENHIASAKGYIETNDTKAAAIELKNALQREPESGEARFLLGSMLLKGGNPVAAEVELRKAQAAGFPDDQVVPELARAMLMLGQSKKVVDEFGQARLGTSSANAKLQTLLASAYGMLGDGEQAQAATTAALSADPQYAEALMIGARQKAAARDIAGALAVVDDIVAREPGNADAWKLKGDILLYGNRPEEALNAYRRALAAQPKYMPAHVAIVNVLMRQGKLDDAGKQLDELRKFAAKHPQTKFFEAQLAYQRRDFKTAQARVRDLLRNAPNNARLLELAGAVELHAGTATQAQIYLSRAVELAPGLPLARRLLIATYLRSGQPTKALSELNAASAKDGVPPALYGLAGQVYLQNGDSKKAEEYFSKALKLDPDNSRRRTALAISHMASGKADAAIDELENIADTDNGITADLALVSTHLYRKEFDKALSALDKLEAKQPDKPFAANLRGRVELARKDNAAARKSFERALSIDPSYFAAAASLAELDLADKKPDDARKRFETLLAQNPKNAQALLALAQLAANQSASKDEIAGLLNRAIDASPADVAPRLLLVDLYLRNNDIKQALASAQKATTALPNQPELLVALGRVQQVSGNANQALATYGTLAALQPLSPMPLVRMAEAQVANKEGQAARISLGKALEIAPDFLEAQYKLVALDIEEKRFQDAVKTARTVQRQRPKEASGFALEGDVNAAQGAWEAAAMSYRAALQYASPPEVVVKLHTALVASGKSADAEKLAVEWVRDHPTDSAMPMYLGGAALARQDYAGAEGLYQSVVKKQPNNVVALNNLAWVMGRLGREGAVEHAEKAAKLAPNQPDVLDTLAMLLAERNDYDRAIELQRKAMELQPANAGLKLNLAKIYIKSGDKILAKRELEALSKGGEKSVIQVQARELLKTI